MIDLFDGIYAPRVLIACEFTGTVRDAFLAHGYDAWSCDLRASLKPSNRHMRCDVRDVLGDGWDLLIVAHPPCTRLCNSGVRWIIDPSRMTTPGEDFTAEERAAWPTMGKRDRHQLMQRKLREGAELFSELWNAPVPRIACENPVMHKYGKALIRGYQPPAQSVQPWEFGDFETKRTCLWLRGLSPLVKTYATPADCARSLGLPADAKPVDRVHKMSPGPDRNAERSKFFPGIAEAMALQWGRNEFASRALAA